MAPKGTIVFYYDVVCPWAYFASQKVGAIAEAYGATLIYRPVLLGGIYELTKAPQGKAGSATDALNDAKKNIANVDFRRTLARSGVTLNWNPRHPVRSVKALRLLHAVPQSDRAELTNALYKAYWVDGKAIDDENVLLDIANGLKKQVKFAVPLNSSLFEDPSLAAALRNATNEVVDRGSPGVPAFWVQAPSTTWREEEALFFGQDRLHFVASMLAGRMIPQPRASIPGPIAKPKVLTFYYDFSSPWAFVGYQLLQRFLDEVKNVKVEWVPIVVGGLFKMIGTPVVPRLAYSPVKVAYGDKDMIDWIYYWNNLPLEYTGKLAEPKVELQWPSIFPIRSVLPLRVAIVEPKTIDCIYRAAWIRDVNVADPAILAKLLTENGFDAKSLLEKADSAEVKETLKKNTDRAAQAGCCGVPSFQVDGSEVFWGQDHLVQVVDELHGATGPAHPRL
ncbi:thioredoxin-like protein [Cladochytrium replicatum]|nr:thioredoxin-like protein [Cladochytrium replicatum]